MKRLKIRRIRAFLRLCPFFKRWCFTGAGFYSVRIFVTKSSKPPRGVRRVKTISQMWFLTFCFANFPIVFHTLIHSRIFFYPFSTRRVINADTFLAPRYTECKIRYTCCDFSQKINIAQGVRNDSTTTTIYPVYYAFLAPLYDVSSCSNHRAHATIGDSIIICTPTHRRLNTSREMYYDSNFDISKTEFAIILFLSSLRCINIHRVWCYFGRKAAARPLLVTIRLLLRRST